MKKFIWVMVLVAVATGFFFLFRGGPSMEPSYEAGILHPLDNVKGNATSSVVIMEYSDFQCPACRSYYSVTRELSAEFGDRVAFVYRHFPLTNIHPNAEFAARASEAAGKQGKFWEMHDLLFEKQSEWAGASDIVSVFGSYAALLGLDTERFQSDFRSDEIKNFVKAQRAHSIKSGLQGTPTFFISGGQIKNPTSVQEFRSIINEALTEARL